MVGPDPVFATFSLLFFGVAFVIQITFLILFVVTCLAVIKIPKQLERLTEVLRERENWERRDFHENQQF